MTIPTPEEVFNKRMRMGDWEDGEEFLHDLLAAGYVIAPADELIARILDLPGTIHPGAPRAISDYTAHAEVNEIAEALSRGWHRRDRRTSQVNLSDSVRVTLRRADGSVETQT